MNNRLLAILTISFAVLIFVTACSPASTATPTPSSTFSTSEQDGATLVQERCVACHPLTRVESSKYTAAQWQMIVSAMVTHGAQLTQQQETIVIDWLSANYGN